MNAPTRALALGVALLAAIAGLVWWSTAPDGKRSQEPFADEPEAKLPPAPAVGGEQEAVGERESLEPAGEPSAVDEEGVIVSGVVLDRVAAGSEETRPSEGATVRARIGVGAGVYDHEADVVTTQEDGRFEFRWDDPLERPLTLQFSVDADERFRLEHFTREVAGGAMRFEEMRIVRSPHGALRGTTVDSEGAPLAGVTLRFYSSRFRIGPPSEAVSDANGRFEIPHFDRGFLGEAAKHGYRLLGEPELTTRAGGGWEDCTVQLGPIATLRVHVEDGDARPVADAYVRAALSQESREGRNTWDSGAETIDGATGADGRLALHEVWASRKLRVEVRALGRTTHWMREIDGKAVPWDWGGRAIVLEPGEVRDLRVVLPKRVRVHGQVFDVDGAAFDGAEVHVRLTRGRAGDPLLGEAEVSADADGHFELSFAADHDGFAYVEAADGPLRGWFGSIQASRVGRAKAPFTLADPNVEIDVQLAATRAIAGRVLDAEGSPVQARVRTARGTDDLAGAWSARQDRTAPETGAFELRGLAPGTHDLIVEVQRGDPEVELPLDTQHFPGVPAGSEDVELRLEARALTEVHVSAEAAGVDLASVTWMLGVHEPGLAPPHLHGGAAPRRATYRELNGWPAAALLESRGTSQANELQGRQTFGYYRSADARFRFPPLQPGWYWIGAEGVAADGGLLVPIGTGLVELGEGRYDFHFALTRTAPLSGRIVAASGAGGGTLSDLPQLAVWLIDENGWPVTFRQTRRTVSWYSPVDASGRFHIPHAPLGAWTLRIAKAESVFRSREMPSHEEPVTVHAGGTTGLTVHVDG